MPAVSGRQFCSWYHGSLGKTVDIHPKESLFSNLPFDVGDFQAFRARYPLGSLANFFQIQAKTPRAWQSSLSCDREQQKSGLAPTYSCDPLQSENRVYSRGTVNARYVPAMADRSPSTP